MNIKKSLTLFIILALFVAGCSSATRTQSRSFKLPVTVVPTATATGMAASAVVPQATNTPRPVLPTHMPVPSPTLFPTLEMFPVVTFAQDTNCRKGPGARYFAVTTYAKGQTAQANARNADGSWISVQLPDKSDYCWVSTALVQNVGNVEALHVLEAQTLPDDPLGIEIVKKICGHPMIVLLKWSQIQSATGYRIYSNGELVATNYALDNKYYDNPRKSQDYTYTIEAFNQFGVSNRISITLNVCN
jgi:hypothetical protein